MSTAQRPVGVAVVAVIAFMEAALGLAAGVGLIVDGDDRSLLEHIDVGRGTVTTYGFVTLGVALLTFAVAWALWRGFDWARILVALVQVFDIASGVYLLVVWGGIYVWSGIIQIVIALIVLWLLYGGNADEFFTTR